MNNSNNNPLHNSYESLLLPDIKSPPPCNSNASYLLRQSNTKSNYLRSNNKSGNKGGANIDDDYFGNAYLMGYGGIFLGKDLLNMIESTSNNSSPAAIRVN